MSREEALDKLDSGSYVMVPKWLSILRNIVSPLAIVSFIFISGSWKAEVESRLFDSLKQKEAVVARSGATEIMTVVEKTNLKRDIDKNHQEIESLKTKTDRFIPRSEIIILLEGIAKDTRLNKELLIRLEKER